MNQPKPRILQVSKGFSYTWDDRRPRGDFVAAEGITLHGRPIDPAARYRVTVNAFLADGGDGFAVLKEAAEPRAGAPRGCGFGSLFQSQQPAGARLARPYSQSVLKS